MLISNCEPILKAIVSKFDSFNNANNIGEAFESQYQSRGSFMDSSSGYGDKPQQKEETKQMH